MKTNMIPVYVVHTQFNIYGFIIIFKFKTNNYRELPMAFLI